MTKKKTATDKKPETKVNSPKKNLNVEHALIENFVALQKVMTTMAVKFDSLSNQISKLLELFEISAKSLAEKGYSMEDKKVAEKMDTLLEQNKIIAKGIALLHEKENYEEEIPVQRFQVQPQMRQMQPEFQKSPQTQIGTPRVKEIGA
jgi:hypothetical protein